MDSLERDREVWGGGVVILSTPCNGFWSYKTPPEQKGLIKLSTPCNGFLQGLLLEGCLRASSHFQLHVMDSGALGRRRSYTYNQGLSTPCNGFPVRGSRRSRWSCGMLFQLHVMDSDFKTLFRTRVMFFQLHVMDSGITYSSIPPLPPSFNSM